MKIGFILYKTNPHDTGGTTYYTIDLLNGLKKADRTNTYYLLTNSKNNNFFKDYANNNFRIKLIKALDNNTLLRKILTVIQNRIFILPFFRILYFFYDKLINQKIVDEIESLKLDVIYYPSTTLSPLNIKTSSVLSLHDIQHIHFPQFFTRSERWRRYITYKESVKRTTVIQATSRSTKKDFINYFGCHPEKVVLIR